MNAPMRVLDLFCGAAGGWSLGLHQAGPFATVAACEVDPWRRATFGKNFPEAKLYDDVRTLTGQRIIDDGCTPDVIVGSPPCQDISAANPNGAGVDGKRSGLFFEAIRIVRELVHCGRGPRWVCLENSPRLRGKGSDRVLGGLEEIGYTARAVVVGVDDIGGPHRRKRVWIIANANQVSGQTGAGWPGMVQCGEKDRTKFEGGVASHPDKMRELQPSRMFSQFRGRVGYSIDEDGTDGILSHPWFGGLAAHRRSNDGIPAGVASECVAAYGDAVVPVIPRLIGRAILSVECRA